ncbi:hypothetical protein QBC47DRAFT_111796 [Echria macrotheca]|uniref:Uncharacterized protein n=1 Tax=Echria macrotheca TaxID=438768 RepID=A0AAJ0BPE4_9PEZI|nr:hypothetical protein QBC47DRAFT_111796 [Echria macrotheca]
MEVTYTPKMDTYVSGEAHPLSSRVHPCRIVQGMVVSMQNSSTYLFQQLVSTRYEAPKDHDACPQHAILSCIRHFRTLQKEAFSSLCTSLRELRDLDAKPKWQYDLETTRRAIANAMASLNTLGGSLNAVVDLFEKHVGRAGPVESRWLLIRRLKRFLKGRFAVVAIDSPLVEELKGKMRVELDRLNRISPILASHIRIRDPNNRDELQKACDTAKSPLEQICMIDKLHLQDVNSPTRRDEKLYVVRKLYFGVYFSIVEHIKKLEALINNEYSKRGDDILNVRGRLGRFGPRVRGVAMCCCEQHMDEEEKEEKFQMAKVEEYRVMASKETYHDQYERLVEVNEKVPRVLAQRDWDRKSFNSDVMWGPKMETYSLL